MGARLSKERAAAHEAVRQQVNTYIESGVFDGDLDFDAAGGISRVVCASGDAKGQTRNAYGDGPCCKVERSRADVPRAWAYSGNRVTPDHRSLAGSV